MDETTTYAAEVLDREQRLRLLSQDLPAEPKLGATTATLPTRMLEESPDGGDLTTPHDLPPIKAPTPRMVGNYAIHSILGRGGMGWVFKAEHNTLHRFVALKMLIGSPGADARITRRFTVEAQALAKLEHPNIVPVFEAGDWDGVPYFAMKYIAGGTLSENAERLRADPRAAVRVVAKIARAVGYLHDQGVSHRDLKPANVLISDGDEPLVADFGLAKLHGTDSDLTVTGMLLGTRYYMSPEQARGGREELTPACDIWALGVILHELLTGKLPFDGESHEVLFQKICQADPPPLVTADGVPQPELGNVVRRCLAKSPRERYPTALAVAEDLERWLAGEAVQAPPPAKRNRWRKPLIAAAVMLLAVGLGWAMIDREAKKTVLIGKTGETASHELLEGTQGKITAVPAQAFAIESDDVGIVSLGTVSDRRGTVIEADVHQVATENITSTAGLYFLGKFFPGTSGRRLNCMIAAIDSIESPNLPQGNVVRSGYDTQRAGRWEPASNSPWNLGPFGPRHAIGRDRPGNGVISAVYHFRIELPQSGPVSVFVNGAPFGPATLQDINAAYDRACGRDPGPSILPDQRWGHEIGLFVQGCKAEFTNVTLQSLP